MPTANNKPPGDRAALFDPRAGQKEPQQINWLISISNGSLLFLIAS
jgi:hypothetical protein